MRLQFCPLNAKGIPMAVKPIDVSGGESVYCFNRTQLNSAFALAEAQDTAGERIRGEIARLESEFSRNERAAVAFVVIDRLLKTPAS